MLGRKSYAQQELDHARAAIRQQMTAHKALANTAARATADAKLSSALEAFDAHFFNNLTLVLDRDFVHRLRMVTGKDGNPLNEVEMLCDSLMNNGGILRAGNVIKLIPEESVVKLRIGNRIRLTAEDFDRLSAALFAEIERKFL
jgi:hypothetical protein